MSSCSKMIESSIQFDMGFSPGGLVDKIYIKIVEMLKFDTEKFSVFYSCYEYR